MEQLELSMEDALNITQHQLADKQKELLTALADLLWPVLRERIADHVKAVVEDKFIGLDEDVINGVISRYIDNNEIITSDDLADRLSDYVEEGTLEDKIDEGIRDYMEYNLEDSVRDTLRHKISLTVEVS